MPIVALSVSTASGPSWDSEYGLTLIHQYKKSVEGRWHGGMPTSPSIAGGTRFRMIRSTALTHAAFMTSKIPLWFARHAWHQPIPP